MSVLFPVPGTQLCKGTLISKGHSTEEGEKPLREGNSWTLFALRGLGSSRADPGFRGVEHSCDSWTHKGTLFTL